MQKIFRWIVLVVLVLIAFFFAIGNYNATKLEVEEKRIDVKDFQTSFVGTKLVHVSDFNINCNDNLSRLQKISEKIQRIDPDILVINGDFINGDCKSAFNLEVSEVLASLDEIVWKFYTKGENDGLSTTTVLQGMGFDLLNKSYKIFNSSGESITLIGVDDKVKSFDVTSSESVILFTHQPDWLANTDLSKVDLAFTAHSQLGKINLPFFKGLIKVEGAKTIGYKDYEQIAGLDIYTSRGVSTRGFKIRINNDPTIHFYRLDKK